MNDRDNYGVIGLEHLFAMRDELVMLRHENRQLRTALDNAVASHQEIQERLAQEGEDE